MSREKQQVRQTADWHVEQLFCESRKLRPPISVPAAWRRPPVTFRPRRNLRVSDLKPSAISLNRFTPSGVTALTYRGGTLRLQSASIKTLCFILASGYWSSKQIHHSEWRTYFNVLSGTAAVQDLFLIDSVFGRFSVAGKEVWRFDLWYFNSSVDTC